MHPSLLRPSLLRSRPYCYYPRPFALRAASITVHPSCSAPFHDPEAAPINPSDIGPLFAPSYGGIGRFGGVDVSTDAAGRCVTALPIPERTWAKLQGSKIVGRATRVGNEGAGIVVAAGAGSAAQALLGTLVACLGTRASYGQHAVCKVAMCMAHAADTSAEEAASSWVNPLTALGMVKTMRAENHTGIVHTAAASQLGQMLVKICKKDGIPLVNVVRRPAQVALLKSIGAEYVVDSSAESYERDLTAAMAASGSTICFDALGGGSTGFEIIKAMESAAMQRAGKATNYGSR
jgi:D-arabinose 1-dehydrogenase-like Zn-dependent alcohol dehydrogenase